VGAHSDGGSRLPREQNRLTIVRLEHFLEKRPPTAKTLDPALAARVGDIDVFVRLLHNRQGLALKASIIDCVQTRIGDGRWEFKEVTDQRCRFDVPRAWWAVDSFKDTKESDKSLHKVRILILEALELVSTFLHHFGQHGLL
jgi:hypothetical protein